MTAGTVNTTRAITVMIIVSMLELPMNIIVQFLATKNDVTGFASIFSAIMRRPTITQALAFSVGTLFSGLFVLFMGIINKHDIMLWCGVTAIILGISITGVVLRQCHKIGIQRRLNREPLPQPQDIEPVIVVIYVQQPISQLPKTPIFQGLTIK